MRVVVDCNVVIAAVLTQGTCRHVMETVMLNHDIIITNDIIEEYTVVSKRSKFKPFHAHLENIILLICEKGIFIKPSCSSFSLPDKDDQRYVDTAITAGAERLITGNIKHFPEKIYGTTRVQLPKDFIESISFDMTP